MSPSIKDISPDFHKVTHVIFDMDGLLMDTESIFEETVRRIAKSYGKPYPQDVRMKIMGTTERRSAEIAVEDLELPITVEEYTRQYDELNSQLLGNSKIMKGAEKLIRNLHAHQIPIAVATSASLEMTNLKISNYKELYKLFNHFVCGSTDPEVKQGKPAPDIFLIAAARFPDKPDPKDCLVFEDSINGVTAGIAAGMQCVMVPDIRLERGLCSHATQVLNSLEEFNPEDFGLPQYN